jgi:ribosomal protein L37AE/L43A
MVFLVKIECPCCQKAAHARTVEGMWHCESCWNAHHNGKRDNDWLDKEQFMKQHEGLVKRFEATFQK